MAAKSEHRGTVAGIMWREYRLSRKGDQNTPHKHKIDHATIIIAGSVSVAMNGKVVGEFKAPTILDVKKEILHQFTALEDNTVYFCMFNADHINKSKLQDF